jgi:hypothetical protein
MANSALSSRASVARRPAIGSEIVVPPGFGTQFDFFYGCNIGEQGNDSLFLARLG